MGMCMWACVLVLVQNGQVSLTAILPAHVLLIGLLPHQDVSDVETSSVQLHNIYSFNAFTKLKCSFPLL